MFELICDTLQAHGIASIRFDFNGHGQSEGEFKDMTVPNEIEDAKKVVEYVSSLPYVNGLAIAGHSQGGVVAAMTAGELSEALGQPAFKAVALMAPAAVLREDAIKGSTMGKMYDPFDPGEYIELFGGLKLGGNYIRTAFTLPIYETAAKYQGPAIIVHGFTAMATVWCLTPTVSVSIRSGQAVRITCRNISITVSHRTSTVRPTSSLSS